MPWRYSATLREALDEAGLVLIGDGGEDEGRLVLRVGGTADAMRRQSANAVTTRFID